MSATTLANTASNGPRQLSDGNPNGTVLGKSTTDKIGFYENNQTGVGTPQPVVQPTSPQQAAIPTGATGYGNASGALTLYTSSQSPSAVSTITTAEQSITVTGVLSTDLVIINKPTSQAGLGVVSGRVSAANTVKLTFANVTAGTLTPTGSESYLVTTIPANLQLSATLTPASVAANTVVEQTFTLTAATSLGLAPGMVVQVNKPTNNNGIAVLSARVPANNQIAITFANTTAGTLTPTAGESYLISGFNGIPSASQTILFGIGSGTLGSVAANTTSEQSITEAGILASDTVIGMQKPTLQAGLLLGAGRVSAASTAKVTFANVTAGTLTPTGSEVYNVVVFRQSPGAVGSSFTATCTPGSVAANTTAEQTFTFTGIVSGQPVLLSPNANVSAVPGIGIMGVRASATNTVAVTFCNTTSASITPAAFSATVLQFNQTAPTAGNFAQLLVGPLQTVGQGLMNATRAALGPSGVNLIAGA